MRRRLLASVWVLCLAAGLGSRAHAEVGPKLTFELRPAKPGPGQAVEVRVGGVSAAAGEALELRLGGRSFPLWKSGEGFWEGLVSLDRDQKPGAQELSCLAAGAEGELLLGRSEVIVGERDYGVLQLSVDEGMVTLSPENQARAERENQLIRSVLAQRTPARLWALPFVVPAKGRVSGPFGVRRVYNGVPKSYHGGLDIAAPKGAPVIATAAGRVALVGDFYYTGLTVFVDHGLGFYSAYFHLSSLKVEEGARVDAGQPVGLVGSTGRSTGPHLHWGMYLSGLRVDPESLLALNPVGGPAE
jgi:hypothetical protein